MPTAKKPSAKKTMPTRKAVKRAPAKSTSATKVRRVSSSKQPVMKSFRPAPRDEPFMTFRINRQTIYWMILGTMVIALAAWVLTISIRVQSIYDQIDATNQQTYDLKPVKKR